MATAHARPKAQPPEKKKPSSTETAAAIHKAATVRTTKEQQDFEPAAHALAATLGWVGEPDWVLNWVQVKDARRYLAQKLHEVHVAALNDLEPPKPEDVCAHLGLDPETPEVAEALENCWEQERGRPTSPTS